MKTKYENNFLELLFLSKWVQWLSRKKKLKIMRKDCEHISWKKYVMFDNSFYFLFSKICFGEYKEKIIFLYFLNKKNVWLVEIKKKI